MSLREKIHGQDDAHAKKRDLKAILYQRLGVIANPFPPAGQPSGHPRLENEADERITECVRTFLREDYASQVLVIEGTHGVGKSNLLNYYQDEFHDLFRDDASYYVIRYYPDPEIDFDTVMNKILQSLGEDLLTRIAISLQRLLPEDQERTIDIARQGDMRIMLQSLSNTSANQPDELPKVTKLAMEWLLGARLLNRHREGLAVAFRLDTVESRTQALRDLVFVGAALKQIRGIFLLLDELEKHAATQSNTPILRYFQSIRAIIDSLPKHLFLMLAMTTEAKRKYFTLLPAMAERLRNVVVLPLLRQHDEAIRLHDFYLGHARERAEIEMSKPHKATGKENFLDATAIQNLFGKLKAEAAARGLEGVPQREFLDELHRHAGRLITSVLA